MMAGADLSEVLGTEIAKAAAGHFRRAIAAKMVCEVQFAFPPTLL